MYKELNRTFSQFDFSTQINFSIFETGETFDVKTSNLIFGMLGLMLSVNPTQNLKLDKSVISTTKITHWIWTKKMSKQLFFHCFLIKWNGLFDPCQNLSLDKTCIFKLNWEEGGKSINTSINEFIEIKILTLVQYFISKGFSKIMPKKLKMIDVENFTKIYKLLIFKLS